MAIQRNWYNTKPNHRLNKCKWDKDGQSRDIFLNHGVSSAGVSSSAMDVIMPSKVICLQLRQFPQVISLSIGMILHLEIPIELTVRDQGRIPIGVACPFIGVCIFCVHHH